MPRDSAGNYSLPAGNPVVGGTTITTAWANPTATDIANELTNSLDRAGRGGMTVPFKFADGLVGAPGMTWNAEPTSGFFRAAVGNDMEAVIAGVPRMRWTASSVDVWDTGLGAWLPIIGPSGSTYALVSSANTFTQTNTFTKVGTHAVPTVDLKSNLPVLRWYEDDATANNRLFDMYVASGVLIGAIAADDGTSVTHWLNVGRTASVVDYVDLRATVLRFNGAAFIGSGLFTVRGTSDAIANNSAVNFTNLSGTLLGYVGDATAANNDITLACQAGSLRFISNALERMLISSTGQFSVYGKTPGTAQVTMGDLGGNGALQVHGTSFSTYFGLGADENTYIRPGKITGTVYIGDGSTAALVQIGAAATPTTISGTLNSFANDIRSNNYKSNAGTSALSFNTGTYAIGSWALSGIVGSFCGLILVDGAVMPKFISSGTLWGVHVDAGPAYWSWQDNGTTFTIGKACKAPSFDATSSRDIKRETGSLNNAREILAKLRPILYRFLKDDDGEQIGLIAEEVAEVCPQLSRDGKTVSYDRLALLLLADWQERYA